MKTLQQIRLLLHLKARNPFLSREAEELHQSPEAGQGLQEAEEEQGNESVSMYIILLFTFIAIIILDIFIHYLGL